MIVRKRHAGGSYATRLSLPSPLPPLICAEHDWWDNNSFVVVPLILKRACAKAQPCCDSQVPVDTERAVKFSLGTREIQGQPPLLTSTRDVTVGFRKSLHRVCLSPWLYLW